MEWGIGTKRREKETGCMRSVPVWVYSESKYQPQIHLLHEQLKRAFCITLTINVLARIVVSDASGLATQKSKHILSVFLKCLPVFKLSILDTLCCLIYNLLRNSYFSKEWIRNQSLEIFKNIGVVGLREIRFNNRL